MELKRPPKRRLCNRTIHEILHLAINRRCSAGRIVCSSYPHWQYWTFHVCVEKSPCRNSTGRIRLGLGESVVRALHCTRYLLDPTGRVDTLSSLTCSSDDICSTPYNLRNTNKKQDTQLQIGDNPDIRMLCIADCDTGRSIMIIAL